MTVSQAPAVLASITIRYCCRSAPPPKRIRCSGPRCLCRRGWFKVPLQDLGGWLVNPNFGTSGAADPSPPTLGCSRVQVGRPGSGVYSGARGCSHSDAGRGQAVWGTNETLQGGAGAVSAWPRVPVTMGTDRTVQKLRVGESEGWLPYLLLAVRRSCRSSRSPPPSRRSHLNLHGRGIFINNV
jgi:hypothetical protein